KKSDTTLKKAENLIEQKQFEAAKKIGNSLNFRFFQASVTRYELLLKIAFHEGDIEKIQSLIIKFSKIIMNEENDYKIFLYWFYYYYLCEDYNNAKISFNNMILNCSQKTIVENKNLFKGLELIITFHNDCDFFEFDKMEEIAKETTDTFEKSIFYYESAYAYFKAGKKEKAKEQLFLTTDFIKTRVDKLNNKLN
ncbi:MAG: hypothetical protein RR483_04985, partial [Clostridia bacterium]